MTHLHLETQLDAYLDGELEAADARSIESHLAQCQECTRFVDSRLALRSAIKARIPVVQAPPELRQQVRDRLRSRRVRPALVWRSLALAASLAIFAVGGWQLGVQSARGDTLAGEVLTSHVRSLMPGHLTDVQSSDRHTVRPWFNGKVDYSPPVSDFATQGYPLLGGRLEYIGGRTVSALVYGRRQHVITVYLWPASASAGRGASAQTRNGYHVLHWSSADYSFWVVSDLSTPELQEFADLLKQADSRSSD